MIFQYEDYISHYGTPRKSGRYPWGSGTKDEKIYEGSFLDITSKMERDGMKPLEIAKGFGITTTQLRARKTIESNERKNQKFADVKKLHDKQMGPSAIGKQLGLSESSVRSVIASMNKEQKANIHTVAKILKDEVDEKKYVQIGTGVEHLPVMGNISANRLKNAVGILEEDGYTVHSVQVDQIGTPGQKTTVKVLTPPGTTYRDVDNNKEQIRLPGKWTDDGGDTFHGPKPPLNIDPKRVAVRYKEQGGDEADGVIFVRPGKEDIAIGGKNYAQVRIAVGGTHYLKGMAVYKDDLPDGVDLLFNTNKSDTGNKLDAMKKQEKDPTTATRRNPDGTPDLDSAKINETNPFGSQIRRQILDLEGKKAVSAMNLLDEEGTWSDWNKSLSSQVLSKQSPVLAKQQLDVKRQRMREDLDEIKSLTNPVVRKHLLEAFADGADSSAVHLDAAHIPRQSTHVLLPVKSLKASEVYAPNYDDGETVVLIRFPHGGKFEIPELTVNNKNREAIKMMGKRPPDAVGINSKVAERLSGADFDGDTVLVIPNSPNNPRRIRNEAALKSLQGFDPKSYKLPDDAPKMSSKTKGIEMGKVSNLITDMTIKGASNEELARAVKHSMVVIDAEKHHLDYNKSFRDHAIGALNERYMNGPKGGASTLISRATSMDRGVDKMVPRKASEGGPIDPKTGRKMLVPDTYLTRDGVTITKKMDIEKLANTNDAFSLVSKERTKIEEVYAEHSNALKEFANEARREVYAYKPPRVDLNAKKVYKTEVASLVSKLNVARANKPLERQAQLFANAVVAKQKEADPTMDRARLKKIEAQALATARARVQANKHKIVPTDEEWAAIQARAVTPNQLQQMLSNADLDAVRTLATPRARTALSPAKIARINSMAARGFNQADIATALGLSPAVVREVFN